MTIEVVTYANTSQGLFEELVNNTYKVPVKVLGWGTKWNGFSDKMNGMAAYLETKKDDAIVVFIDGFDTKINQSIDTLLEKFKAYDCKILVSKDPEIPGPYITRLIFGQCQGSVVNSGMYMGYVKELKHTIDEATRFKCKDDQVNFNTLCSKYDFIKIDENETIFKNIGSGTTEKEHEDALFISYPGSRNLKRIMRSTTEYAQFMYVYILILLVISTAFFPRYGFMGLMLYLSFFILFADKSCLVTL